MNDYLMKKQEEILHDYLAFVYKEFGLDLNQVLKEKGEVLNKDWDNDKAYEYVIVLNDKIIGACSAASVDVLNKKAELACWLAKDYRGNGYAMESVRLLEQELFKNGFNKIVVRNDVLNKDSVNLAIKAGYELEGVLKADKWLKDEKRFRDVNCFAKFKKK